MEKEALAKKTRERRALSRVRHEKDRDAETALEKEARQAREEEDREMSVMKAQREARKEARDKGDIDSWRIQQMDSWHEAVGRQRFGFRV